MTGDAWMVRVRTHEGLACAAKVIIIAYFTLFLYARIELLGSLFRETRKWLVEAF